MPTQLLPIFLTLALALPELVLAAGSSQLDPLSAREAAAVRKALHGLNTTELRNGREEAVLRQTIVGTPSLSDEERRRIETHLWNDIPTIRAVQELLNLRQHWRKRSVDLFVFWWHPGHRDAAGIPARSPTTLEAEKLEEVARSAGKRLGIEAPAWMPYIIDPLIERARTYSRTDLRWGVWAPNSQAFDAVVELVAREQGGVPALWKPLGRLLGTCHGDEAARAALLRAAEESADQTGLVPVLELLTAGTLGGMEDPAFATSLLLTNLLLRECSAEELGALLSGLKPGLDPEEVRRVLRNTLASSPERFDRRLRSSVLSGRRDRLGR